MPDCGTYTVALYVATVPTSAQDAEPPTMPVPDDAASAVDRRTAATDDSTGELHTADDDEPEGTLNDTAEVSTTVVGGTGDAEGLNDDETDEDALVDCDALVDAETEDDDEIDADAADDEETEADSDCDGDADRVCDTLADTDSDEVSDADTLLLNEALGDDELL